MKKADHWVRRLIKSTFIISYIHVTHKRILTENAANENRLFTKAEPQDDIINSTNCTGNFCIYFFCVLVFILYFLILLFISKQI